MLRLRADWLGVHTSVWANEAERPKETEGVSYLSTEIGDFTNGSEQLFFKTWMEIMRLFTISFLIQYRAKEISQMNTIKRPNINISINLFCSMPKLFIFFPE